MSPNRSEASYILHDIIPILSRHGYPGAGDHERAKINEVPIYRPSGGRSGSTMDIVYYHNGEPLLLVEAKRKYKSHDDALSEAKNYHLNFPRKDRAYAPSGKAPEFLATTVGNDIQFYKIRYEIENNSPVAISEKIDILSWDDLLDSYGLKPAYKAKKLEAASFRSEFLNHLAAIYVVTPNKKITPEVVKNVAWQILQYLEDDVNYQSRPPYTSLDREVGRQSETRDLFRLFDLKGSLGPELAEEFRSFILRSFQGREFNQFMTEQCVIDFMCQLVGDLKSKVLDFECGSGGFLASAISHWNLPAGNIMGVDLDDLPYILAKTYIAIYFKISGAKISDIPIKHNNGLFYWGNDWDLIISNPAGGNKYPPKAPKGQQREINRKYALNKVLENLEGDLDQNARQDKLSEYNFSVQQAVRSCRVDGKICLILPEGFFSNSQDEYLRKYLVKHCRVLAIVSLPRGAFKRGTSTRSASQGSQSAQMKMSILYAQKKSPVIDKAGLDLDGLDLSYPIFLASIADPESTSGSIETWLEPRLNTVLEQWQSWQKTGELTKPSFKEVETSKSDVQETMINKADKKEIAKLSKPQHKSTHKVDEHLKGFFQKGN